MTEQTTRIRKGHFGWTAETSLPLGFTSDGKPAELHLSTYGKSGKVNTYAGVKLRDGAFITTRVFRDFHEHVECLAARATEKTIRDRHAAALADLEAIKARAIAFHTAKGDLDAPPAPPVLEEPAPAERPAPFADETPPTWTTWGAPQGWKRLAAGIYECHTASHGGFWITAERLEAMPASLRALNWNGDCQWFEEDSDWALVVRAFPAEFSQEMRDHAQRDREWRDARPVRSA